MPLPRFLASNPAVRATTTAARMIWQSKIMTLGVFCEILAVIAAVSSWFNNLLWLPNAALTLATLGAVAVATKIAWDYHGRGLNTQQRDDVGGILLNERLNETQKSETAKAIESSGLTTRQRADLPRALRETEIVQIVEAQRVLYYAIEYLRRPGHGQVVVIHRLTIAQLAIWYLDPPPPRRGCQRQHPQELGTNINFVEVAESLYNPYAATAVLWLHPGSGYFCHTNNDAPEAHGRKLMFSLEDCVPKWHDPMPGEYVLMYHPDSGFTWEQQPKTDHAA